MITIGSCFSGIGGLEYGLELTGGFETKWQIEYASYPRAVLNRHWPTTLKFTDITLIKGDELERVDLICGGFPCQDVSYAGRRRGLKGERSTLWKEMFRIICCLRPRWVLVENVPGLLSSDEGEFFGSILRDLAQGGYDAEWEVHSAHEVGAPHLRERLFLVAYPVGAGRKWGRLFTFKTGTSNTYAGCISAKDWPLNYDPIPRDAYGVSKRVAFSAIGNAVVPLNAQKVGEAILRAEEYGH